MDLGVTIEDVAQPLYYAASTGLFQVVKNIIPQVVNINANGGKYGNALQAALVNGYEYGNALKIASVRSHEKMVQILLDAGADVNTQGGRYGNALQVASADGEKKVVRHGAKLA